MALCVPHSTMKAFSAMNMVQGEFGCSSLKLRTLQRIAFLEIIGTRPSGYQLDTAHRFRPIPALSSHYKWVLRIRFPGFQPWFGQHGLWQKTLCLVKWNFSHYSYFTFHSCAAVFVGPYVTCRASRDPFLYVGCVGVSEVGLQQAAVGPARDALNEVGRELHTHVHEEGTSQLDHCALDGVSHCFIHHVQEILHASICKAREGNCNCCAEAKDSRDCPRALQLSSPVLTLVSSDC